MENVANHLAPLYMNPNDPSYPERKEKFNVDWTVKEYLRLGVPAEKINVGVPYYAAGWQEVNGGINGLFGTSSKPLSSTQFHYINSLLKSPDLGLQDTGTSMQWFPICGILKVQRLQL